MLSDREKEAQQEGEDKLTKEYLNKHVFLAMFLFILVFASANIWSETLLTGIAHGIGVERGQLSFVSLLVIAVVYTLIIFVFVHYVVHIPITAAYSL